MHGLYFQPYLGQLQNVTAVRGSAAKRHKRLAAPAAKDSSQHGCLGLFLKKQGVFAWSPGPGTSEHVRRSECSRRCIFVDCRTSCHKYVRTGLSFVWHPQPNLEVDKGLFDPLLYCSAIHAQTILPKGPTTSDRYMPLPDVLGCS